jgi:hypothetical protein
VDLYGLVGDGLVVMYRLVDLCICSDVIYICYVSVGCDIVIHARAHTYIYRVDFLSPVVAIHLRMVATHLPWIGHVS